MTRSYLWMLSVTAVAAALPGCRGGRPTPRDLVSPQGTRWVTAEQIEATGAKTAWDAIRLTVPNYGFRETNRGTPARVIHRGRSSMLLDDQPRVYLDGTRLTDFQVLDQMPARDVFSIEVLSGIEGTTYHGSGAGNGVIRIRTKSAL